MVRATSTAASGPHQAIAVQTERERFAAELFDILWDRYRSRVSYVVEYEKLVGEAGATFVNDHIAFRSFACQRPATGIPSISRVFESLGYRAAGSYHFEDKQLSAIHYQHPNSQFPKLFISELKVWELSRATRELILRTVRSHRDPLDEETLAALCRLDTGGEKHRAELLDRLVDWFHTLPWKLPDKRDVLAVNEESQYAAWVLVHGYNVNHFTSLINSHGVDTLRDIEKTAEALQRAGVPMKAGFEGERESKLRQTATEAVRIDVDVLEDGQPVKMPWTYAYFELAERGEVTDPDTGERARFEGFLGPQATQLFEMTRVR